MQTAGFMMFGLVLAPCGWILNLCSATSPNWRTVRNIEGEEPDLVLQQGIWDICWPIMKNGLKDLLCTRDDKEYFSNQVIGIAQWMMVTSLSVTLTGLAMALGAHCCSDRQKCVIAGLGGVLLSCSGVLAIIPIAWYAYMLPNIHSPSPDIQVGHCIVLGCIGGGMEVLSGIFTLVSVGKNCNSIPYIKHSSKYDVNDDDDNDVGL